jgi:hypothetical protein
VYLTFGPILIDRLFHLEIEWLNGHVEDLCRISRIYRIIDEVEQIERGQSIVVGPLQGPMTTGFTEICVVALVSDFSYLSGGH